MTRSSGSPLYGTLRAAPGGDPADGAVAARDDRAGPAPTPSDPRAARGRAVLRADRGRGWPEPRPHLPAPPCRPRAGRAALGARVGPPAPLGRRGAEGACLGAGEVRIATPLKREARDARLVVAVEDFTAAQRLAGP